MSLPVSSFRFVAPVVFVAASGLTGCHSPKVTHADLSPNSIQALKAQATEMQKVSDGVTFKGRPPQPQDTGAR